MQLLDAELEPEFLFVEIRSVSISNKDKHGVVTLALTGPLHPCLAKHFEEEAESDVDTQIDSEDRGNHKMQENEKKDRECTSVCPFFTTTFVRY